MKRIYIKPFNALKKMGLPVYEHADDDGNFSISSEEPSSSDWVNYYSDNQKWIFGVHPMIEAKLKSYGVFAEWVNPGRLSIHKA